MAVSVRLERRADPPLAQRILRAALAVVLGAFAGGVLVQASGYDAQKAFGAIIDGSFGGSYPISQTLAAAIPLATIALGTAVAFRVQLWNIGGEGQFYMGAFGATGVELIGGPAGWPAIVLLPAMLVAGFVAGAAWALLPAWLRAWHGVNEIITTLMLNYVAVLWVNYLVYGPWKDPAGRNFPFTPRFPDSATFARMGDGQLHTGLFVPIAAALVLLVRDGAHALGLRAARGRRKRRSRALRGHQRAARRCSRRCWSAAAWPVSRAWSRSRASSTC